MERMEASSLVAATRPEGSSVARLMRLPVERRSRDWVMSALFWLRRLIPEKRDERLKVEEP